MNLDLADPTDAPAFVEAHRPTMWGAPILDAWPDIRDGHGNLVEDQQLGLQTGSWLLAVLAVASVAVLVGGRMADQTRRVGLLKAVGGTPRLVAAVLLAEFGALALATIVADADPQADRLNQVLVVVTAMLVALAAVNAVFVTWATALDARQSSALARALGATPHQVGTGLSAAQVLPALAGALLGIPGGLALFAALSSDEAPLPPIWQLLAVAPATVLVITTLTTIPARLAARRPTAEILQSELT